MSAPELKLNGDSIVLNKRLRSSVTEMVQKYQIAVDKLTEEQTAEAIMQMIKCGEFMRYVTEDGQSQQIVYLPYREAESLKARIAELEEKLATYEST